MKRAVLIDVSAVMYRAYFSLMNMRNSKQEPTGAVYGFINILSSIIEEFKPDYIAACFDVKRSSLKRKEELESYKENRSAVPEELLFQIPLIEKALDIFNIEKFKIEGYEADDVIGTLATRFSNENVESIIVTGDKDLSQLVGNGAVTVALIGKGEGKEKFKLIKNVDDVIEQLGVAPDKIPDLFGLQGDSSDGIPGVKGIGPKTAVKLLEEYGSLEGIYENVAEIKGKVGEKLAAEKEMAFISKKLATIERFLDVTLEYEKISRKEIDGKKAAAFFKEMEFKTLIKKFGVEDNQTVEEKEESLFIDISKFNYKIISSEDELKSVDISKFSSIILSEAGASLYSNEVSIYIPLFHSYLGAINADFAIFKEKISEFSGSCYDLKSMYKRGFKIKEGFDCMIAFYLLYPEEAYNFEWFIKSVAAVELQEYKELFGKTEEGSLSIEESAGYLCKKVFYMANCVDKLKKELEEKGLKEIFYSMELPLIEVLHEMEKNGIKIDKVYFEKYKKILKENINLIGKKILEEYKNFILNLNENHEEIIKKILELKAFLIKRKKDYELYKNEIRNKEKEELLNELDFNISSPQQLAIVLFKHMNIPSLKKTKTNYYSTDEETMQELSDKGYDIAKYIIEHRKYSKLLNTYVEALQKQTDEQSRIHTTFNQNGTATGRLSSSNPNLQNIPAKTEEGMLIRGGFISEPGWSLVSFDYSQIELRVLAELSRDEALVEAYKNSMDLHTLTAMKIFEKEHTEVTREERTIAKVVNFSIIYGKTPFGLSKEIDITMADAKKYIDRYFEEYSGVKQFIERTIAKAEKDGDVSTYFGRKRAIQGITSSNKNIKSQADRMAVNSVIQGTAADILKIVMVKLYEKYKNMDNIKIILQVHDELIFEIKDEFVEQYSKEIASIMEHEVKFEKVNLEVNYAAGKKWSDTK